MKAFVIALPAMFLGSAGLAQGPAGAVASVTQADLHGRSIQAFAHVNEGRGIVHPVHVTPTMQRQQLARAVALRREAQQLLAQDGGTLTAEHARYLRRAAREILSGAR